jgi:membrane protease subunit HflK
MSDEHEHHDHAHEPSAPERQDSDSQALAEALRSSFVIVKIVMAAMVVAFFFHGFFTVGPQEKAVILRFGKPIGEGEKILLDAGLHWSFPYPIDQVVKIPIAEQQIVSSTVGWYMTTPEAELSGEEMPAGPTLNPAIDGYVLTADRNIIHTRATLRYHIDDPMRAVFGFAGDTNFTYSLAGVSNVLQNALNNALLYTAASFNVDDILLNRVDEFREAVQQRATDLAEQEDLGIVIEQCDVESRPPRQLQNVFDQVTDARVNRDKALIDAHSYENQVTNNAGAQAVAVIDQAEADRTNYVASITADAKRFSDLLPGYETNRNLFAQMTLVQTMGQVLTNVQDKIYLPQRADGQPRELRLMLNREPPEPKPATSP